MRPLFAGAWLAFAVAVAATFKTIDGTALAGSDYAATTGTVRFAAGISTATIRIPITNDALNESDETFYIELSNATGGASIGGKSLLTAIIINDDSAGGLIQWGPDVKVNENAGVANLTIVRQGSTAGIVTVNYTTANSSAQAGGDFTATSGAITFNPGETTKTVTIPILDDMIHESTETFGVQLTGATGGAVIGAQTWAVVTITDNDP